MKNMLPAPRARAQAPALTLIKGVAMALALLFSLLLGARLAGVLSSAALWPALAAGLVTGYLLADFLSGTVHWFCDTFFAEDTPFIGPVLIRPFRDHHRYPDAITEYGLLEQDASSAFIVLAPLILAWRAGGPDALSGWSVYGHAALWAFSLGALGTNLFHKWAHAAQVPAWIGWLQRARVILAPHAHHVHHSSYTGGYCVTSGHLNPWLDRIGFYARLERLIRWLLRRPRTMQQGE